MSFYKHLFTVLALCLLSATHAYAEEDFSVSITGPDNEAVAPAPRRAAPVAPRTPPVAQQPVLPQQTTPATPVTNIQARHTVGPRESIWSIAHQYSQPYDNVNEFQAVASIYRNNRSAFDDGNVNRVRRGAVLDIPVAEEMALEQTQTGSDLLSNGTTTLPPLNRATTPAQNPQQPNLPNNQLANNALVTNQAPPAATGNANDFAHTAAEDGLIPPISDGSSVAYKTPTFTARETSLRGVSPSIVDENNPDDAVIVDVLTDEDLANENAKKTQDYVPQLSQPSLDLHAIEKLIDKTERNIQIAQKDIYKRLDDNIHRSAQVAKDTATVTAKEEVAEMINHYEQVIAELQQSNTELQTNLSRINKQVEQIRNVQLETADSVAALSNSVDGVGDGLVAPAPSSSLESGPIMWVLLAVGLVALLMSIGLFIFKSRARREQALNRSFEDDNADFMDDDDIESQTLISKSVVPPPTAEAAPEPAPQQPAPAPMDDDFDSGFDSGLGDIADHEQAMPDAPKRNASMSDFHDELVMPSSGPGQVAPQAQAPMQAAAMAAPAAAARRPAPRPQAAAPAVAAAGAGTMGGAAMAAAPAMPSMEDAAQAAWDSAATNASHALEKSSANAAGDEWAKNLGAQEAAANQVDLGGDDFGGGDFGSDAGGFDDAGGFGDDAGAGGFGDDVGGFGDAPDGAGDFGADAGGFGSDAGGFGDDSAGGFGDDAGAGGFGDDAGGFGDAPDGAGDFGADAGDFGDDAGGFGDAGADDFGAGDFGADAGGFGSDAGGFGDDASGFGDDASGFGSDAGGGFGGGFDDLSLGDDALGGDDAKQFAASMQGASGGADFPKTNALASKKVIKASANRDDHHKAPTAAQAPKSAQGAKSAVNENSTGTNTPKAQASKAANTQGAARVQPSTVAQETTAKSIEPKAVALEGAKAEGTMAASAGAAAPLAQAQAASGSAALTPDTNTSDINFDESALDAGLDNLDSVLGDHGGDAQLTTPDEFKQHEEDDSQEFGIDLLDDEHANDFADLLVKNSKQDGEESGDDILNNDFGESSKADAFDSLDSVPAALAGDAAGVDALAMDDLGGFETADDSFGASEGDFGSDLGSDLGGDLGSELGADLGGDLPSDLGELGDGFSEPAKDSKGEPALSEGMYFPPEGLAESAPDFTAKQEPAAEDAADEFIALTDELQPQKPSEEAKQDTELPADLGGDFGSALPSDLGGDLGSALGGDLGSDLVELDSGLGDATVTDLNPEANADLGGADLPSDLDSALGSNLPADLGGDLGSDLDSLAQDNGDFDDLETLGDNASLDSLDAEAQDLATALAQPELDDNHDALASDLPVEEALSAPSDLADDAFGDIDGEADELASALAGLAPENEASEPFADAEAQDLASALKSGDSDSELDKPELDSLTDTFSLDSSELPEIAEEAKPQQATEEAKDLASVLGTSLDDANLQDLGDLESSGAGFSEDALAPELGELGESNELAQESAPSADFLEDSATKEAESKDLDSIADKAKADLMELAREVAETERGLNERLDPGITDLTNADSIMHGEDSVQGTDLSENFTQQGLTNDEFKLDDLAHDEFGDAGVLDNLDTLDEHANDTGFGADDFLDADLAANSSSADESELADIPAMPTFESGASGDATEEHPTALDNDKAVGEVAFDEAPLPVSEAVDEWSLAEPHTEQAPVADEFGDFVNFANQLHEQQKDVEKPALEEDEQALEAQDTVETVTPDELIEPTDEFAEEVADFVEGKEPVADDSLGDFASASEQDLGGLDDLAVPVEDAADTFGSAEDLAPVESADDDHFAETPAEDAAFETGLDDFANLADAHPFTEQDDLATSLAENALKAPFEHEEADLGADLGDAASAEPDVETAVADDLADLVTAADAGSDSDSETVFDDLAELGDLADAEPAQDDVDLADLGSKTAALAASSEESAEDIFGSADDLAPVAGAEDLAPVKSVDDNHFSETPAEEAAFETGLDDFANLADAHPFAEQDDLATSLAEDALKAPFEHAEADLGAVLGDAAFAETAPEDLADLGALATNDETGATDSDSKTAYADVADLGDLADVEPAQAHTELADLAATAKEPTEDVFGSADDLAAPDNDVFAETPVAETEVLAEPTDDFAALKDAHPFAEQDDLATSLAEDALKTPFELDEPEPVEDLSESKLETEELAAEPKREQEASESAEELPISTGADEFEPHDDEEELSAPKQQVLDSLEQVKQEVAEDNTDPRLTKEFRGIDSYDDDTHNKDDIIVPTSNANAASTNLDHIEHLANAVDDLDMDSIQKESLLKAATDEVSERAREIDALDFDDDFKGITSYSNSREIDPEELVLPNSLEEGSKVAELSDIDKLNDVLDNIELSEEPNLESAADVEDNHEDEFSPIVNKPLVDDGVNKLSIGKIEEGNLPSDLVEDITEDIAHSQEVLEQAEQEDDFKGITSYQQENPNDKDLELILPRSLESNEPDHLQGVEDIAQNLDDIDLTKLVKDDVPIDDELEEELEEPLVDSPVAATSELESESEDEDDSDIPSMWSVPQDEFDDDVSKVSGHQSHEITDEPRDTEHFGSLGSDDEFDALEQSIAQEQQALSTSKEADLVESNLDSDADSDLGAAGFTTQSFDDEDDLVSESVEPEAFAEAEDKDEAADVRALNPLGALMGAHADSDALAFDDNDFKSGNFTDADLASLGFDVISEEESEEDESFASGDFTIDTSEIGELDLAAPNLEPSGDAHEILDSVSGLASDDLINMMKADPEVESVETQVDPASAQELLHESAQDQVVNDIPLTAEDAAQEEQELVNGMMQGSNDEFSGIDINKQQALEQNDELVTDMLAEDSAKSESKPAKQENSKDDGVEVNAEDLDPSGLDELDPAHDFGGSNAFGEGFDSTGESDEFDSLDDLGDFPAFPSEDSASDDMSSFDDTFDDDFNDSYESAGDGLQGMDIEEAVPTHTSEDDHFLDQLNMARVMFETGSFEEAMASAQEVLDNSKNPALVKAAHDLIEGYRQDYQDQ